MKDLYSLQIPHYQELWSEMKESIENLDNFFLDLWLLL